MSIVLSCFIVVLVLAALLYNFCRLHSSLKFAQEYDLEIRKGRYESLQIYKYIRHHVHIVIVTIAATFPLAMFFFIFWIRSLSQLSSFLEVVLNLLTVLLAIHTAFIACYESINPEKKTGDTDVQSRLRDFRMRFWNSALLIFIFVLFTIIARAVLLVFA